MERLEPPPTPLPWVRVADGAPYFVTEDGAPWTPIGQNDAVSWPDLAGLFRRRDLAAVEDYLRWLRAHGVTVLRLMLECAHKRHRLLENPTGRFVPSMVQLWDDLFALCERHGLRLLLAPYDTFWTWIRWRHHPLNRANGGPCEHPSQLLLDAGTRDAVKRRFTFAVERWGGSGALFAWDLWNEIHPAHAADRDDCVDVMDDFIADVSAHVRDLETRRYGRAHPQTVSLFGPELEWRPHLPLTRPIFRHPDLDFATTHVYKGWTIDHPEDTVAPAVDMGRLVREALAEIRDGRPYFDSEHGPIHLFKDRHVTLPEPFDDAYFRHIQWAHLASGGAGGGMRWPNRHPHVLTHGMRAAQRAMADFLPLMDWPRFRRRNLNEEAAFAAPGVALFACGDDRQAVAYVLRTEPLGPDGQVRRDAPPLDGALTLPGLAAGRYAVTAWDPTEGAPRAAWEQAHDREGPLAFPCPALTDDLALAVRRLA